MLTSSEPTNLELVGKQSLQRVCASPGPFISIFLPARHPGAANLPRADRLKNILRDAAAELTKRDYQGPIPELIKHLQALDGDPSMQAGADDSVIFVCAEALWSFRSLKPVRERLVVATHPYINPLLPDMIPEREFYILALGKKHLRLGRWRDGECIEVPLPGSLPNSLAEFGNFDQPDHDLENRSASGSSNGQMRGVHFGTSPDRDQAHLHDYFRAVDRELGPLLAGAPLVLAGVNEELAAYRRAAKHSKILDAAPGSPEHVGWPELARRAEKAIMAKQEEEAVLALNYFLEATRRDHVAGSVREVLEAATQGRVHKLLLAKDAEYQDLLGPLYPINQAGLEGPQDLLNAASVETIRLGGDVYILDPGKLASAGPIAAVLRYSVARQ